MEYATSYDIGDKKRESGINEDSVAMTVFEHGHRDGVETDEGTAGDDGPATRSAAVFALADGAGGHEAGDVASYLATTAICNHLAPLATESARANPAEFDLALDPSLRPAERSPTEYRTAVEEAVIAAHREILQYADAHDTQAYTTVVAGLIINGRCHYGWVGDSRAYVFNGDRGRMERLTKDHSVIEELADAGEVDEVAAHVHPRGNEITRALGGGGEADPETATVAVDTKSVPLFAEDVLLITSDGLIDAQTDAPTLYDRYMGATDRDQAAEQVKAAVVTDAEIAEIIMNAESLDAAAPSLIELGNERGGKDNLSVILARDRTLPQTPTGSLPVRDIDGIEPIEDRKTVLIPDE
jgi:serine/threonine protein phosphatase PrpC